MIFSQERTRVFISSDVISSVSMIWRWMMPYYVGIFGQTIGIQILAVATAIRTAAMLVVIFAIALFW